MPLNRTLPLLAALTALLVLTGCSRRAERIVGNARLLRGPQGLGTTFQAALTPDRDTFVEPNTRDLGTVLLVGQIPTYQARTFLKVAAWRLPDTTDLSLAVQQVKLVMPRDTLQAALGIRIEVSRTDADWDSTSVVFPGPGPAEILGSADEDLLGANFQIPLSPGTFAKVKDWAHAPASVPGFLVRSILGQGVGAYRAGTVKFRIVYNHTVSGNVVADSIDSPVTQDLYLHSSLVSPPTGVESTLELGGLNALSAALHFIIPALPAGSSINEATLVLRVLPSSPLFAPGQTVDVQVRQIGAGWSEAVTAYDSLKAPTVTVATRLAFAVTGAADSLITVALPASIVREWSDPAAANDGVVVSLQRATTSPKIQVGSRESGLTPELRVGWTTPPPGRF